ncbi:hypothetical protein Pcac1_g26014 [Phytophthora cactorum]|nr:hypothetical protein Pcac1_g26014 [Phytophthora cactorum]
MLASSAADVEADADSTVRVFLPFTGVVVDSDELPVSSLAADASSLADSDSDASDDVVDSDAEADVEADADSTVRVFLPFTGVVVDSDELPVSSLAADASSLADSDSDASDDVVDSDAEADVEADADSTVRVFFALHWRSRRFR